MALTPGSRIGSYEVVAQIGAGGMGTVYRARDTKLNRDVALKVLSDSFVDDPARLARLRREAQLLASVDHAHIAGIHGIEDDGQATALVLEFVDGPTLAERIAEGPVPVDETVSIARQICDALDAAHEHGIVHRDLKPANIKIRADGTVKVLDFGLAKAADAQVASSGPSSSHVATAAPMTQAGVILGTAAYMSPEQARGQVVDKRTDIWAFGCVLFEMLTGSPAFHGENMSDIVANVLRGGPDWSALPAGAGPFASLIQRCLDKDLRRRFRDIADVRMLLDATAASGTVVSGATQAGAVSSRTWRPAAAAAAIAGVLVGGGAVWLLTSSRRASAPPSVQRFELQLPATAPLTADTYGGNVVIAPDGSRLVYTSSRGGVPILVTRTLDSLDAHPLAGSENAMDPFFSPDSQQIGFSTFSDLKRVAATGGPITAICPIDAYYSGASWGPDGSIVFAQGSLGLFRVPVAGGKPEQLAVPDKAMNEQAFRRPVVLPGGRAVLFTVLFSDDNTRIVAQRLDTKEMVTVLDGGFGARYLPSGHLIFGQRDRLMAVRFDVSTLRTTGAPIVVQEGVYTKVALDVANVSSTDAGDVVYVAGHASDVSGRMVWLDRQGKRTGTIGEPVESPRSLRLSPDARKVAVTIGPPGRGQIWIYDVAGGVQPLKLTFQNHNLFPQWSPDGKRLAFMERTGDHNRLLMLPSDGSVLTPETVTPNEVGGPPVAWSPDSSTLLLHSDPPSRIQVLRLQDRRMTRWLDTPFAEHGGSFSPDGRWVAYDSDQSGSLDIWVRPFPGPGAPVRVSSEGGNKPIWSRDGKEIIFENGPKMMASRVLSLSPEFRVETPRLLFEGGFVRDETDPNLTFVDVAPDGRLLAAEAIENGDTAAVVVVQHWEQELKRLLP